jgi:hypothetical protein
MGTSVYFNNQNATREQFLIEDLIIESIKNHGIDIYYIPRESRSSFDELFGDDPVKAFLKAYPMEMYLETFNEFEGNSEFFSKFGLEIQKAARVAVARRTFERYVPTALRNTPKEGDLIWMPIQQKLLEIKKVEEEKNFFQAGKVAPYMFGLSIETFKYSGEYFDTGITEIDAIQDITSFAVTYTMSANGTSTFAASEKVYQGASLATATATGYVASWDLPTRKLELRNIKGEFAANSAIVGSVSGASWIMSSGDVQEDSNDTFEDNVRIETEADNIIDWSETNPFGSSDE